MNTLIILLLLLLSFATSQGFVASSRSTCKAPLPKQHATATTDTTTAFRLNSVSPLYSVSKDKPKHSNPTTDDAPLSAFNESRIDATALAKSIPSGGKTTAVGPRQINRPRWYNKAEATIIVLLVHRLRLLDIRGVEHMLETTEDFRKEEPVSETYDQPKPSGWISLIYAAKPVLGRPSRLQQATESTCDEYDNRSKTGSDAQQQHE